MTTTHVHLSKLEIKARFQTSPNPGSNWLSITGLSKDREEIDHIGLLLTPAQMRAISREIDIFLYDMEVAERS